MEEKYKVKPKRSITGLIEIYDTETNLVVKRTKTTTSAAIWIAKQRGYLK